MDTTEPRREADKILAELPDRISDVIKPFVRESPDHPALVQGDVTWTYGDLAAIVARTAIILADYGVRPGDRVMIVSENSLALAAILLAASEIDAWSVVVNPRLSEREIDLIRDHSSARRVFYTIEVSDNARQNADRHGAAGVALDALGTVGIGPLNEQTVPEPVETDRSRQVAALVYTSGTTGNPKGVMLTHRNVLFGARMAGAQRDPTDKAHCVLPISHIVGYSAILIASLMVGATVQLVPRYDPAALVSAIANDGVTLLFGVPATYQRLLEYKTLAGIAQLPRGKLRRLAVAGAPLDVTLKSKIEAEFGLLLRNGYGITECAPAIAGVRAETQRSDDAVGSLIAGIDCDAGGSDGACSPATDPLQAPIRDHRAGCAPGRLDRQNSKAPSGRSSSRSGHWADIGGRIGIQKCNCGGDRCRRLYRRRHRQEIRVRRLHRLRRAAAW
jgi:acyl-CoA synthetase (AMP-forming)/AMP-acid ligase II